MTLCRTCDACHERKMAVYRPDVLRDPNYWADEAIEPWVTTRRCTAESHQRSRKMKSYSSQPALRWHSLPQPLPMIWTKQWRAP